MPPQKPGGLRQAPGSAAGIECMNSAFGKAKLADKQTDYIDVAELRIGHFVFLDMGWINHPFPLSAFRIESSRTLDTLRALGVNKLRVSREKSDPGSLTDGRAEPRPACLPEQGAQLAEAPDASGEQDALSRQRASLQQCERQFSQAADTYRRIAKLVHADPVAARESSEALVEGIATQLQGLPEASIRLLSGKAGEKNALHAVNVTVLSLLLGRACGVDALTLRDIGLGAFLHDLGKVELPDRLRHQDQCQSAAELQLYREHVDFGVDMARRMGVTPGALLVIGQHHECADGSGYPLHVDNSRIQKASCVVSLVNAYDNLCNPSAAVQALTPHAALAHLYSRTKSKFDAIVLQRFVRLMGAYPPGSAVELNDGRHALVVAINSTQPLKPRVMVHDPAIPPENAMVLDLQEHAGLFIQRSMSPLELPKAAIEYLSPPPRVSYYFEESAPPTPGLADANPAS